MKAVQLSDQLDTLFINDALLSHYTGPIKWNATPLDSVSLNGAEQRIGWRDVLLVGLRAGLGLAE